MIVTTRRSQSSHPTARPRRHPFTLIELLVVVSIIAILAGMLLPVLSKARYKARQTKDTGASKQMALGYIMYTDDNADYFPRCDYRLDNSSQDFGARHFMRDTAFHRQMDRRPIAVDYGFMAVTGCVMSAAPSWDDAGNTGAIGPNGTYLLDNRRYYPAEYYDGLTANDKTFTSPAKVTQARSTHVLFSSTVTFLADIGLYEGPYVDDAELVIPAGNTSAGTHVGASPKGGVSARIDGSVHWVEFSTMIHYGSYNRQYLVPNEE